MTIRIPAIYVAALLPLTGLAQSPQHYQCAYGDLQRRVEIVHETAVTVPCEVHYYKDTEQPGEREVLWRALNEEGYCEARAQAFVEQLQDWGWQCAMTGMEAASENAVEADDTESLAPAEDSQDTEHDES